MRPRVLRDPFLRRCSSWLLQGSSWLLRPEAMIANMATVRIVAQPTERGLDAVVPMGAENTRTLALWTEMSRAAPFGAASGCNFLGFAQAASILIEFRLVGGCHKTWRYA